MTNYDPGAAGRNGDQWVVTLWRDWLTDEIIASLGLNDRQQKAINVLRQQRRVTNTKYQEITGASRATAKRDLVELVHKRLLILTGAGRGAFYQVLKKRLINGSNGSLPIRRSFSQRGHKEANGTMRL